MGKKQLRESGWFSRGYAMRICSDWFYKDCLRVVVERSDDEGQTFVVFSDWEWRGPEGYTACWRGRDFHLPDRHGKIRGQPIPKGR